MVVGLFIITAIPTVTGVSQAISAQKNREQREKDERRMKKFNIDVECDETSVRGQAVHNGRMVAKDGKMYIGPAGAVHESDFGYVSQCMLIEYPDSERVPVALGLVSQVSSNPPLLNWVYIDKDTMELKYGNKTASIAHHVGSWDWTDDEQYMTIEEVSGDQEEDFIAVQDPVSTRWRLFYDMDGDWLASYVPASWQKLQVRLKRKLVSTE